MKIKNAKKTKFYNSDGLGDRKRPRRVASTASLSFAGFHDGSKGYITLAEASNGFVVVLQCQQNIANVPTLEPSPSPSSSLAPFIRQRGEKNGGRGYRRDVISSRPTILSHAIDLLLKFKSSLPNRSNRWLSSALTSIRSVDRIIKYRNFMKLIHFKFTTLLSSPGGI